MQEVAIYFRPAFAEELLSVHNRLPRFDQRSTPRRYLFIREADRTVLAEAETMTLGLAT